MTGDLDPTEAATVLAASVLRYAKRCQHVNRSRRHPGLAGHEADVAEKDADAAYINMVAKATIVLNSLDTKCHKS